VDVPGEKAQGKEKQNGDLKMEILGRADLRSGEGSPRRCKDLFGGT